MITNKVLAGFVDNYPSLSHCDSDIFPDSSVWYSLYERTVHSEDSQSKVFESLNTVTGDRVVIPMQVKTRWMSLRILSSMANYYSVDYRPLCSSYKARSQISQLVKLMFRDVNPDVIFFFPVDIKCQELIHLNLAIKNLGWQVYQKVYQANWVHELRGDFHGYIKSRPKRLQNTIHRKSKLLCKLPGVVFKVHDGQSDLADLMSAYSEVYGESWKVAEPHVDFVPGLMRQTALRNQLRVGLIKAEGINIAVSFWIVKEGVAYIYKLAHHRGYDRYSPGTVLMTKMIEYVMLHDEVKKLDFLSGDDKYKGDWMDERHEKYVLYAYNPKSIKGQIARSYNETFKPILKGIARFLRLS